jgi:hypothetical protein
LQPDGISQQSFLQDGASRQIVPTIWLRRLWLLWVWKVTSLLQRASRFSRLV